MDARMILHEARLAKGLSLAELAARTALSPTVLEKIDRGAFDGLPAGVYARSYVRAVAVEVGLDPLATLTELDTLLPPAHDPFPVPLHEGHNLWPSAATRLPFARGSAAALDALLLLGGVVLPVIALAAWSSGVEIRVLLADAGGALAAFCAVPVALYFLLFEGVGGATPGRKALGLCDPDDAGIRAPLSLPQILRRALSH